MLRDLLGTMEGHVHEWGDDPSLEGRLAAAQTASHGQRSKS
jgi:hypothetical protein